MPSMRLDFNFVTCCFADEKKQLVSKTEIEYEKAQLLCSGVEKIVVPAGVSSADTATMESVNVWVPDMRGSAGCDATRGPPIREL